MAFRSNSNKAKAHGVARVISKRGYCSRSEAERLIRTGRHLYMAVDDRCGPPYTVILDSDYKEICPWAKTIVSGEILDEDLTDEAVELFASEADNREQRRAKKAAREKET